MSQSEQNGKTTTTITKEIIADPSRFIPAPEPELSYYQRKVRGLIVPREKKITANKSAKKTVEKIKTITPAFRKKSKKNEVTSPITTKFVNPFTPGEYDPTIHNVVTLDSPKVAIDTIAKIQHNNDYSLLNDFEMDFDPHEKIARGIKSLSSKKSRKSTKGKKTRKMRKRRTRSRRH